MALPMARPQARKNSRHLQFRKRIPEDVLSALRSTPGWRRRGWGVAAGEVTLSLERERQPGETDKATHARLAGEAERVFAEVRRGVRALSDEEIAALAGEAYALATLPDNEASKGRLQRKQFDLTAYAAELVAAKGILPDATSLERLTAALAGERGALIEAAGHNAARAAGDYRSAPAVFPEWPAQGQTPITSSSERGLKLSELVDRFLSAKHPRIKANTLERYKPALLAFVSFTRNPPASAITEEDIRAFKEHRLADGKRTVATYYRADLPAIKSLYKWATDKEHNAKPLLRENPARDVRVLTDSQLGRAATSRTDFYPEEIRVVLRGALSVQPREGERDPLLVSAKRWCPWIAAYTGARIASITGLRKEDIREEEGGVWFFTFPPEKGCPRSREVPIHAHLIEQGFLAFVESRPKGSLFYTVSRKVSADASSSPAQIRAHKIAEWVRKDIGVDRPEVSPNHGWRHTWKTRAMEAGILENVSDAITGHSLRAKGAARSVYEHPSRKMLAEAMRKFPRYGV